MENKAERDNDASLKNNDAEIQPNSVNVEDALEALPLEKRKVVEEFMTLQQIRFSETNTDMVISEKITSEHITEFLNGSRENMRLGFAEKRSKRCFALAFLAIIIIATLAVIFLLKDKPDIMEKIVYCLVSAGSGLAGGYGFGYANGKKDKE